MEHYDAVKSLAERLHDGQVRKYTGEPYVNHVIEVAQTVIENGGSVVQVYAALLHDSIEDCDISEAQLLSELEKITGRRIAVKVLTVILSLTDIFTTENFPYANRKARKAMEAQRLYKIHPNAQTVKYADMINNMESIQEHDPKFAVTYIKEKKQILKGMNKGNKALFERCVELVGGTLSEHQEEMTFEEACAVYPKAWAALAKENRRRMQEKGFWGEQDADGNYPERNKGEMIALMHSELSECLEALRHGNPPDDKIPEFSGESAELADVQIRMLDYDGGDVNVGEAVIAKMKMNTGREKKHGKAF